MNVTRPPGGYVYGAELTCPPSKPLSLGDTTSVRKRVGETVWARSYEYISEV